MSITSLLGMYFIGPGRQAGEVTAVLDSEYLMYRPIAPLSADAPVPADHQPLQLALVSDMANGFGEDISFYLPTESEQFYAALKAASEAKPAPAPAAKGKKGRR